MKVIDILNGDHKPFASFELVPPLKGSDINKLYSAIKEAYTIRDDFVRTASDHCPLVMEFKTPKIKKR